jgi:hypothetical protein
MIALSLTIYFIGKLLTWMAYRINPSNFKREFTDKDVENSNYSMIIAVILWSIIFYAKL